MKAAEYEWEIERAEDAGRKAAKAGGSQNDNPYKNPRDDLFARTWSRAFCNEAFGTEVFDD